MPKKIKRKKPLTRLTGPGEVKMSEVIAEFAQPLLREAQDEKAHEIAISMAATCWNLSLLSENEIEKNIQELVSRIENEEQHKKDTENIVQMFLDRKKKLFPHIRKMVVYYDVQFVDGQMHLNVASTHIR